MLKSMTGFAKFETDMPAGKLTCEARSLNNRYLEVVLKLTKNDYMYEQRLRELAKRYVKRGKVDISLKWERGIDDTSLPKINDAAVRHYIMIADTLKKDYGVKGELALENILTFRDIIAYEENNSIPEEVLLPACEELLRKLSQEKEREGQYIQGDIEGRLKTILQYVNEIESLWPATTKVHEDRLRDKIKEITESVTIDEARMLQELAIYMERTDITEEIVRLRGHIENFQKSVESCEAIGRKLDFIIQEMVRESNTIGSKSNDLAINERVIHIKVEIEKIREQAQNVE